MYICEGMTPTVHTGQSVQSGQQLGTFIPGGGIETGFAAAAGSPVSTPAAALDQQSNTGDAGANRTYCGSHEQPDPASGGAGRTHRRPIGRRHILLSRRAYVVGSGSSWTASDRSH